MDLRKARVTLAALAHFEAFASLELDAVMDTHRADHNRLRAALPQMGGIPAPGMFPPLPKRG